MEKISIYNQITVLEQAKIRVLTRGKNSKFGEGAEKDLKELKEKYGKVKGKNPIKFATVYNLKANAKVVLIPGVLVPEELSNGIDEKYFETKKIK